MLFRADGGDLVPDDVRAIRRAAGDRPYEITVGVRRSQGGERKRLAALASAGATWAAEYVPASDRSTMRAAVDAGPLLIH